MLPPLPLDPTVVDYLALGSAVVAIFALLVALVALRRLARLRRGLARVEAEAGSEDLLSMLSRTLTEVDRLREDVAGSSREALVTRRQVGGALRHVAVERYDGLGKAGGRLSFSVALLDAEGTGVVFTSINGRAESRTYAKPISRGASEHPLSPEEEQVISRALGREADAAARTPAAAG